MYLFIHIPKAAGTTFNSILKNNFGKKYIRLYESKKIDFFTEEEMRSLATFFPQAQCVSSHDFTCPIPQPDNSKTNKIVNYEILTFLRHPVERSLSHYFFQKKQVKLGVKKDFVDLSYPEYFKKVNELGYEHSNGKWAYQADMQAYVLDREYNLETAKKRMREEFFFVGTSERFDESLLILRKKFKEKRINFKINYFPKNVSGKKRLAKEILAPEVCEEILNSNRKDLELWQYANSLLDEEIKKYGSDFAFDLNKFQRQQKFLSIFAPIAEFFGKVLRRLGEFLEERFSWF